MFDEPIYTTAARYFWCPEEILFTKCSKTDISEKQLYRYYKRPGVRLTFTELRVNYNVYSAYSRSNEIGTYTCPLCYRGEDSVKHLLYWCPSFNCKREFLFQEMKTRYPDGHGLMILKHYIHC